MRGTSPWQLLELAAAELQAATLAPSPASAADAGRALRLLVDMIASPAGFRGPGPESALQRPALLIASMTDSMGPAGRASDLASAAADAIRTTRVPSAEQSRAAAGKLAAAARAAVDAIALVPPSPGRAALPAAVAELREALAALPREPAARLPAAAWLHREVPRPIVEAPTQAGTALRGVAAAVRDGSAARSLRIEDLRTVVVIVLNVAATARDTPGVVDGTARQATADAAQAWRAIGSALQEVQDGSPPSYAVQRAAEDVRATLPALDAAAYAAAVQELPDLAAAARAALAQHAKGDRALHMAFAPMEAHTWNFMRSLDPSLEAAERPMVPLSPERRAALVAAGSAAVTACRELRAELAPEPIAGLDRALLATAQAAAARPVDTAPATQARPMDAPGR